MYFPQYLFKRNVVGSPSCLIARRALYPRFDERLRWLVDVDVYYRLRIATGHWCVCDELKMGSTIGRKDSITASIKGELKTLDAQERIYLSHKHPQVRFWLTLRVNWILNFLEGGAWLSMRFITFLYNRLAYIFR